VAPLPFATAADKIPVDNLKAPKGFKIEVYATGMVNARSSLRRLVLSGRGLGSLIQIYSMAPSFVKL
jgi:hypothetical protein